MRVVLSECSGGGNVHMAVVDVVHAMFVSVGAQGCFGGTAVC